MSNQVNDEIIDNYKEHAFHDTKDEKCSDCFKGESAEEHDDFYERDISQENQDACESVGDYREYMMSE